MNVDFLTLACLRDRLDGLLGARVQRAVLVDELSVGLELYARRRHQLLMVAHPQNARVLLVPDRVRRGVEGEPAFLLLLRKWVRGSRLVDVTQPPWERILSFRFDGPVGPSRLVAEVIGRYSNVILLGPDGRVLDAVKRIGPGLNRYRVILPGHTYQPPPPPPGRRPPLGMHPAKWDALLADANPEEPLQRLLPRRLLGVSPTAAREIATRACGDPEGPVQVCSAQALAAATAELFAPLQNGAWAPHVASDDAGAVIAFAPYELRQFQYTRAVRSISVAMWLYFRQRTVVDPYAAARGRVQVLIDQARMRTERALDQLRGNLIDEEKIDALREAGELLLAYQARVPWAAQEVTLPDYAGQPRTISLDPAETPLENAQEYFRRYRKALRAAEEIPPRAASLEADQAYLEQLSVDLAQADSRPEIDAVLSGLAAAGWAPGASRGSARQVEGPRRLEIDGFTVHVGRNARQNDTLTFEHAGPEDLWLHVRGLPGAHVIVKTRGQSVPEQVVEAAAQLAATYSSARGESRVPVDVVERRYVRRLHGRHPGLVTYRNERTLWVTPTQKLQ